MTLRERESKLVIIFAALCVAVGWQLGVMVNIVGRINEVNQRPARLVLGWVTMFRWLNHLGM